MMMIACGSQSPSTHPTSIALKVGVLGPLSGPAADLGAGWAYAATLAVKLLQKDIAAAGLSSVYSISSTSADDQCLSTPGVEAATKLVSIDNDNVIVGPICSGPAIPVDQSVLLPRQIPMFTGGTSPAISALSSQHLVFRTVPSDAVAGPALAQAVGLAFGKTATINIGAINNSYGVGLLSTFEAAWMKNGGAVGQKVIWNPTQPTYDTEAQKLVSGNPAGWVFITQIVDWPKLEPALVRTGKWDPSRTWGADDFYCNRDAFPINLSAVNPNVEAGPGLAFFKTLWNQQANPPTYTGTIDPEGFDDTIIAFLAAAEAKSVQGTQLGSRVNDVVSPGGGKTSYTPDQLVAALQAIHSGKSITYAGVTGVKGFDANGDPTSASFVSAQVTDTSGGCKVTGHFNYNS
jgi:branched-chain amino acid transport system substrate-binding protein